MELRHQAHRRQRILDFVRHLLGHFAPRTLFFSERKRFRILLGFVNHSIVRVHELPNLVFGLPRYRPRIARPVFGVALHGITDDVKTLGNASR